jgi:acetyl-CoA C-acetyltransferase
MTEAVIVSTARSPIGRAGKGSLVNMRPDDLAAQMVRAALDKVPGLDPREIDDLIMGCGQPGGEAGFNIGRAVAVELGYDFLPGTTVNVALLTGISREDQDHWGVRSQNRAEEAINSGFFEREIVPVTLPDGSTVAKDDGPRAGTTYEAVSQLKPVFRPNGTITAGNACPLNDGAAAVVVVSDAKAKELGLKPLARIVATGVSGLSPEVMGLGPIEATRKALANAGMTIDDIDLYEINEAFAVQVLGSARELGMDHDKLNVSGGAIALGHPFGMTGARITATLLNNLQTHDKQFGLETMCVGGGQGMAMIIERLS